MVAPRLSTLLALLPPLALAACASAKVRPAAPVDLTPARQAVDGARKAGAPAKAPEVFKQAEHHLAQAEALVVAKDPAPETPVRAAGLGELAAAEAHCATTLAHLADGAAEKTAKAAEAERTVPKLRKAEDDNRRLEERIALLLHDLEITETEVIRTKARLKGIGTKAEASSAIAEARILMGRLDPRTSAATLSRCEESLAKAEKQIKEENYGAALFFAIKAQDVATKARDSDDTRRPSPSPPSN